MRVSKYERLPKDKDRGSHEGFTQNMASVEKYKSEDESDHNKNIIVVVEKMALNKSYVCRSLKPAKIKEAKMVRPKDTQAYSFNIDK